MNEYNFHELKNGDLLYIKTDAIYDFYKNLNKINKKFVLVTGCGDYTIPNDLFNSNEDFLNFINDDKIIKWYVQNCVYLHPKIIKLPIGLDYHTMFDSNHEWGSKKTPIEQENEL